MNETVGDEWKEGNEKRLGTMNETVGDEWKEGYEKRLGTVNETVQWVMNGRRGLKRDLGR